MRRETNKDRQQRLFVTGLLISAVVGALIGLLWPLWFPADSACETTIPDASFSVPTLAMGGTQLPGEEGAAMKICCLTFDDGPSKYTPQVLAALEKCDAKATFFVTAQDANQDYLSYLTDIEAAGHQIALHSASHSYSRIYSSTENFWLDIKALRATLANYIDVDAIHWLRFPGGSTNTVSHRYGGRQIMQQLKAQAEQKAGQHGRGVSADLQYVAHKQHHHRERTKHTAERNFLRFCFSQRSKPPVLHLPHKKYYTLRA